MRTVVLIGCPDLEARLEQAGYAVVSIEYFWIGEPRPEWVAAIIDAEVGGGTGLAVAERLRRKLVVPLVVYRSELRQRVLPHFLGAERSGDNFRPELIQALDLCMRQTLALRAAARPLLRQVTTTQWRVSESMIVSIDHGGDE